MNSYQVFQLLVLVQPFFWMWLFNTESFRIPDRFLTEFMILGFITVNVVLYTGFNVGYYTNNIIIQYILMVLAATWIYETRKPLQQAIALAFLTVYLNSLYWELPYHLAEILQGTFYTEQLYQLLRLIPAIFLIREYRFNDQSLQTLGLGYFVALVSVGINMAFPLMVCTPLFALTRPTCLWFLTKTIIEAEPKK